MGRGTLGRSLCRTSRHSAWDSANAAWFSYETTGGGREDKERGEETEYQLFRQSSHFEDKVQWSSEQIWPAPFLLPYESFIMRRSNQCHRNDSFNILNHDFQRIRINTVSLLLPITPRKHLSTGHTYTKCQPPQIQSASHAPVLLQPQTHQSAFMRLYKVPWNSSINWKGSYQSSHKRLASCTVTLRPEGRTYAEQ